jgi:hypothetical protein
MIAKYRQGPLSGLNERDFDRLFTAVHEAGHAAMCLILRKKFSHVTARRAGDAAGHVKMSKAYLVTTSPSFLSQLGREVLICVSGAVAEALFLRQLNLPDALTVEAVASITLQAWPDLKEALSLADTIYPEEALGPEPKHGYVDGMIKLAGDYLQHAEFASGLMALAAAIYSSRKKIGYHQARSIFFGVQEAG